MGKINISKTRTELQNRFQGSVIEGSTIEDLPAIAENVNICNPDGLSLSYTESRPFRFSSENRGKARRGIFRTFFHMRRILLSLTDALEGTERSQEIDAKLLTHCNEKEFFYATTFGKFLLQNYESESLVIAVLKCLSRVRLFVSASGI